LGGSERDASLKPIAFGPRAGQEVLTVQGVMPRDAGADINGLSLHAAVRCGADDRRALEQLCRYITRPARAYERAQTHAAGEVVLKLKTPRRHHPPDAFALEFMQRLAAVVPRPRHPVAAFLLPFARWKKQLADAHVRLHLVKVGFRIAHVLRHQSSDFLDVLRSKGTKERGVEVQIGFAEVTMFPGVLVDKQIPDQVTKKPAHEGE
jgi:hypothetical protein